MFRALGTVSVAIPNFACCWFVALCFSGFFFELTFLALRRKHSFFAVFSAFVVCRLVVPRDILHFGTKMGLQYLTHLNQLRTGGFVPCFGSGLSYHSQLCILLVFRFVLFGVQESYSTLETNSNKPQNTTPNSDSRTAHGRPNHFNADGN